MNNQQGFRRNAPKKSFQAPSFRAMKSKHTEDKKAPQNQPASKFNATTAPREENNLSLDQWLNTMELPLASTSARAPQTQQASRPMIPAGARPMNQSQGQRRPMPAGNSQQASRSKSGNFQNRDISRDKSRDAANKARQDYRRETQPQKSNAALPVTSSIGPAGNKLRIIPLGGAEEVGRNMTVFEYGDDIIILDMGIQFPEEDMPGISYIIPNVEYLRGKERNIKGVIFSHGHLDHIGASPILLEKLGNPLIIGRPLTLAMIKHRQDDYKKDSSKKLKTVVIKEIKDQIKLGAFDISFFAIDHSIMDAVGVIIKTPTATVLHPGDWTLEKDKSGRPRLDYSFLTKLPRPTVLMLESLGTVSTEKSVTTEDMQNNLHKLIDSAPGRTIIGTFSSQTERISWIIELAEKLGKKVALDGYSMKMNVEIAKKLGYIKANKSTLIKIEEVDSFPEKKVIILCTGSQGEDNAVLARIIDGTHKAIKLRKTDTVILSSSIIPGNERTIQRLKDNLYRQCDNVIHGNLMDIHVSGHGNRDDIVYMLRTIKPDYFIPSYANHYMLKEAAMLARSIGFDPKRIFVPDNGSVIEFAKDGARMLDKKVPATYVFVDGLGITDMNNIVLRDRQQLAEDGMLVVIATVDGKTGELIMNPDIISRGFVYLKENKRLIEMVRTKVRKILKDDNPITAPDDAYLRDKIRNDIGKFLFQKTEKRPMILPVIIEV